MLDVLMIMVESTCRLATPLAFGALAAFYSERSGVINICVEGMLLVGAFFAAVGTLWSGSPWLGLVVGGLAGVALAALYALFVLEFEANQIVAGTAINLFAFGLTPYLSNVFYHSANGSPAIPLEARFTYFPSILVVALFGWTVYWFRQTYSGLWMQFCGDHPKALKAAGASVVKMRWIFVAISGLIAGLGGASLSLQLSSSFVREMSAGRGFMALAALILGRWQPTRTLFACILFGATDALQIQLQGHEVLSAMIPPQLIQSIPYLVTLAVLAFFVGASNAPAHIGRTFSRHRG